MTTTTPGAATSPPPSSHGRSRAVAGGEAQFDPDGRTIRLLMPLAILAVATGAFILSFAALRQVAVAANVAAGLAWIWPVIIDAGVIVNVAAALVLRARGQSATYPWASMGIGVAISVVGNAIHATATTDGTIRLPAAVAMICAAVPPLVLMQATHLGALILVRRRVTATAAVANESTPAQPATDVHPGPDSLPPASPRPANFSVTPPVNLAKRPVARTTATPDAAAQTSPSPERAPRTESPDPQVATPHDRAGERRLHVASEQSDAKALAERVRTLVVRGDKVTGQTVADLLAVSARTGSRRLKELTDRWPGLLTGDELDRSALQSPRPVGASHQQEERRTSAS